MERAVVVFQRQSVPGGMEVWTDAEGLLGGAQRDRRGTRTTALETGGGRQLLSEQEAELSCVGRV